MTLDAMIDEILKRAGDRVVDRLSSCINLSPDHAASIRRAASNISQAERADIAAKVYQARMLYDGPTTKAGLVFGVRTDGL